MEEELGQRKVWVGEITMFIGCWMKPRKRKKKSRGNKDCGSNAGGQLEGVALAGGVVCSFTDVGE